MLLIYCFKIKITKIYKNIIVFAIAISSARK